MKVGKRVPAKALILLTSAALVALIGSSTGWFGSKDPRAAFLDAVSTDLAKDPRVTVVRVDHTDGQLTVHVKPISKTYTLLVTKIEAKTFPGGHAGEEWSFEWKDPAGNVVSVGHGMGSVTQSIHIDVPGLP